MNDDEGTNRWIDELLSNQLEQDWVEAMEYGRQWLFRDCVEGAECL